MFKPCRFNDSKHCYHTTCDVISSSGVVTVCPLYRGGNKFAFRKVGGSYVSIFALLNGHGKRRGSGS